MKQILQCLLKLYPGHKRQRTFWMLWSLGLCFIGISQIIITEIAYPNPSDVNFFMAYIVANMAFPYIGLAVSSSVLRLLVDQHFIDVY